MGASSNPSRRHLQDQASSNGGGAPSGIIFFHVSMKVLSTSGVTGTSAAVENTWGLVDRKRRRPALAARRNTFDVRQIEQQRRRSGEELREINGGAFFRVWRVGVQMLAQGCGGPREIKAIQI